MIIILLRFYPSTLSNKLLSKLQIFSKSCLNKGLVQRISAQIQDEKSPHKRCREHVGEREKKHKYGLARKRIYLAWIEEEILKAGRRGRSVRWKKEEGLQGGRKSNLEGRGIPAR
jgi:hypothetical protein